ncbi:MAG: formylmethanofuran dehydrogenase [Gammaproteobacteria bacterium]|nr:formylmethanofuran dehydrogenase [Gammaproteobacteria bacterium]
MLKKLAPVPSPPLTHAAVTCPFCGLLCDDLTITARGTQLTVMANGCPKASAAFKAADLPGPPLVNGQPASLEAALDAAARILQRSQQPLFAGLGTDVAGLRALLALAEPCHAIVDHLHGAAMARQVRVLQSRGLIQTTLAEVRNRADLVVLLGVDINTDFQRFAEICLTPAESLVPARLAARRVFQVGPAASKPRHAGVRVERVPCAAVDLRQTLSALRAELRGRPHRVGGRTRTGVTQLAHAIRAAQYTVIVWAPGQLAALDGDLIIASAGELIADINRERRAAGLVLGGNDGGQTALAVCTWITGYPLRLSFAGDTLDFDPLRYQTARLLGQGAVDALLWLSTFSAQPAPATPIPRIVIGNAASTLMAPNSVFLPAGTPGLDHPGQLLRTDAVVALPLRELRPTATPSAAALLLQLAQRLR